MRKVLFALALGVSVSGMAQLLNVGSIEKVNIPENKANKVAAISPDGSYLLVTTDYNQGLTKYDLATGQTTVVTDAAGAGYDAKISSDGQTVVYREKSTDKKHLQRAVLASKNMATGERKELVKSTRNLQGFTVEGKTAIAVNKGKMSKKALSSEKAQVSAPVLSIDKLQLMITENGKTRVFSPLGTQYRYIWPSVSPDGQKALFFVSGKGAYVCNIDGTGLQELGTVRAPKWFSDNIIVGMNDKDNGEVYTSSEIVAVDLQGNRQVLTDDSVIAMYPLPAAEKIAFSTPTGEAYIINLK